MKDQHRPFIVMRTRLGGGRTTTRISTANEPDECKDDHDDEDGRHADRVITGLLTGYDAELMSFPTHTGGYGFDRAIIAGLQALDARRVLADLL